MWANLQLLSENFQKAVIALLEMNIDFHQCDGIGGGGGRYGFCIQLLIELDCDQHLSLSVGSFLVFDKILNVLFCFSVISFV